MLGKVEVSAVKKELEYILEGIPADQYLANYLSERERHCSKLMTRMEEVQACVGDLQGKVGLCKEGDFMRQQLFQEFDEFLKKYREFLLEWDYRVPVIRKGVLGNLWEAFTRKRSRRYWAGLIVPGFAILLSGDQVLNNRLSDIMSAEQPVDVNPQFKRTLEVTMNLIRGLLGETTFNWDSERKPVLEKFRRALRGRYFYHLWWWEFRYSR